MKDEYKFRITKDGTIETIYDDSLVSLAEDMGGTVSQVCRASNVEWEEIGVRKGWTVRAAHNPNLAIMDGIYFGDPPETWDPYCVSDKEQHGLRISIFSTREEALEQEVRFFWKLLPPKEKQNAG